MSRARASELVLVNWKGVFFERYLLDPNVTALEGDNGAGKTTVMIAAYVTLLPDLSRLRFTNLGETGATGGDKGIWGRLGQLSRPSFSALTLQLGDGSSVIAGVHLKRKSEPALELTPFIIQSLPPEARARDFLLETTATHEQIPTLDGVERLVERAGAQLETYSTNRAYFSRLFELGVSPMRLGSDEELGKYNDMLRTSMTGGISRALTSELRSFVFKQETGLSDALGRMRTSLNACRKTRLEVAESRELNRQITGVFEAGAAMFQAAVLAARATADERDREVARARQALVQAKAQLESASHDLSQASAREHTIGAHLKALGASHEAAKDDVARHQRALKAHERKRDLERELASTETRLAAHSEAYAGRSAARERAKEHRQQCQAALTRSAQGLANLQAGLEEVHRRAHAHRHASEQLGRAARALEAAGLAAPASSGTRDAGAPNAVPPSPELSGELLNAREQARAELERADEERARRTREAQSAELMRREHAEARSALAALVGPLPEGNLVELARHKLAELADKERLAGEQGALEREVTDLTSLEERRQKTRRQAEAAGLASTAGSRQLYQQLSEFDTRCRDLRERAREASWRVRTALAEAEQLEMKHQAAKRRVSRFQQLTEAAKRLGALGFTPGPSAQSLSECRQNLLARLGQVSERVRTLTQERDEALARATALETLPDAAAPELLALRDELGGELLVSRFEDLDPETAPAVEARLGPLRQAIVVTDVRAAREQLEELDRQLDEVWLVPAGTDFSHLTFPASPGERDVVVETDSAVRISRMPEVPSLGRAARERRARALRQSAASRARLIEDEERVERGLIAARRDLDELSSAADDWTGGDPSEQLERLESEITSLNGQVGEQQRMSEEATLEAEAMQREAEKLRLLIPDAALLDAPSSEARLVAYRARLEAAKAALKEVESARADRKTLSSLLDALRSAPPGPETLAQWEAEAARLSERRDQLFLAVEALDEVRRLEHALHDVGAEHALSDRSELVPTLEEDHRELERRAEQSEAQVKQCEQAWEAAAEQLGATRAEHAAISAHLQRVEQELSHEGVPEPSEASLEAARAGQTGAAAALDAVVREARELSALGALAKQRRQTALDQEAVAQAQLSRAEAERAPTQETWQAVEQAANALGFANLTPRRADFQAANSQQLWSEAGGKRALLLERLAAASGGDASDFAGEDPGEDALATTALWERVRAWLHKRLPAQVAEIPDPVQALSRLRDDLATLEGRLLRQESDLRGASADVARSIDVQVRRATSQVRRINQYLTGVRFGSIHGIRVKLDRVESMAPVLEAMRNGSAQRLLFQGHLPLEEALEEIFKRYGGGRGGGQRILDYREYMALAVEVKRQTESSPWEPANPTRVSTGEAIGVGAALMMVILTEWERDSTLLRSERTHGSLRFLFLDEANRLSQDNLGVLFDLCQSLELQLLIAAPEVARATGNTTYRLVRRVAEDGSEEVLVTGRRAQLPEESNSEEPGVNDSEPGPAVPVQEALFE